MPKGTPRTLTPKDLALFSSDVLAQELLRRYEPCVVAWLRPASGDDGPALMQIHAHTGDMGQMIRSFTLAGMAEQGIQEVVQRQWTKGWGDWEDLEEEAEGLDN